MSENTNYTDFAKRMAVHEAICDKRYDELRTDIKEVKAQQKAIQEDIKALSGVLSKGSGAIGAIFIVGTIIAGILGLMQIIKGG